jgi:hypothetical protein
LLRTKRGVALVVMSCLLVNASFEGVPRGQAHASGHSAPERRVPSTVHLIAELESERLRAEVLKKSPRVQVAPNQLLSIHGVSNELWATLLIDGMTVVLRQGVRQRLGLSGQTIELRSIRPPCVSLVKKTVRHRLCLRDGVR